MMKFDFVKLMNVFVNVNESLFIIVFFLIFMVLKKSLFIIVFFLIFMVLKNNF